MSDLKSLKAKALKNEGVKEAYDALETEFEIARSIIELRANANLTQEALAELMNTKQSTVARLESGKQNTTLKMLQRIAEATGTHLKVSFE